MAEDVTPPEGFVVDEQPGRLTMGKGLAQAQDQLPPGFYVDPEKTLDVGPGTQMRVMARGIPILKNYIAETPESQAYEKALPGYSAVDKMMAGGIATAPLFAALPGYLGAAGVGGALSAADTATEKPQKNLEGLITGQQPQGHTWGDILTSGAIGAGTGVVGNYIGNRLGEFITPHPATPAHQNLVQTLENEGVNSLTAGQRTGSFPLKQKESVRADEIGRDIVTPPQEEFTRAAMRRVGQNTLAGQGDIQNARDIIGQSFQGIAARNNLTVDQPLMNDLTQVLQNYQTIPGTALDPHAQNVLATVQHIGQPGRVMAGPEYARLRSVLSYQSVPSNLMDNRTAAAYGGIRDALDEAMERSIQAGPHPADAGDLAIARQQYRNLLSIEKARGASGEGTAHDLLSPPALQSAVKSTEGVGAYARGQGDLSQLANAGVGVMKPPSNSGTQTREAVSRNRDLMIALTGLGAGEETGRNYDETGKFGSPGSLMGTVGGGALGMLTSNAVRNAIARNTLAPYMQRYLANQSMTPQAQAILNALMAGGATSALGPKLNQTPIAQSAKKKLDEE